MLHVVLFNPEIPQNTGNVGRLCAFTNSVLHLIRPLGFEISDRHLRRSGMDYWQALDVRIHDSWQVFRQSKGAPQRLWLFTTRAKTLHWDVQFQDGDGLVFGNEGHGAPSWLHEELQDQRLKLASSNSELRSLNLSTSAGIAVYEALRQIHVDRTKGTEALSGHPKQVS